MKNLLLLITSLLLISCSNDNSTQKTRLLVNHYKQTTIGVDKTLLLVVQENENVGSETWTYLFDAIEGFDYEFGYVYELDVQKQTISNPPADGSSIQYELIEVISKTQVQNEVTFDLTIKSVSMISPPDFVLGDSESGYTLLNEINIDCDTLCDQLSEALANEDEVKGTFTHLDPSTIKLNRLIIE